VICGALPSDDSSVLVSAYEGLCRLSASISDVVLSLDRICVHFDFEPTVELALLLLSLHPISAEWLSDCPGLLPNLFAASTKARHALFILFEIWSVYKCAAIILDDGKWLQPFLPTFSDTIHQFLILFQHAALRSKFLALPEFVPFLRTMISMKIPAVISVVAGIVRRVLMTPADIIRIDQTGLYREFLSVMAGLLFAYSIGRLIFVNDLTEYCELIVSLFDGNESFVDGLA
jgi:hypothetical protein